MSRIDELLDELCPDGVPLRALGTVGEFIRGNGLQKKDLTESGFPAIHYGQIHTHYGTKAKVTKSFTSPGVAAKLRLARPGDLLIATTSEDDAAVAKATAWLGKGEVALSGDAYIFRHSLDPTYVSYYFQSEMFQKQKRSQISGTKVRRVSGDSLARINIPEPPLTVQREVVRILDTFAELEVELGAELMARKRQYEHVQRSLLTFPAGAVEWMTLGDLGPIAMCRRIFKSETMATGDVPFFKVGTFGGEPDAFISQTIYDDYRARCSFPKRGDVLLSAAGTIGRACQYDGRPAYFQDSNIVWIDNDEALVSNAYLKYWYRIAEWTTDGGTIRRLYNENLRRTQIAVPSRAVQDEIVATLDACDALVSDLSVGLPAELAARRKQYEHYRDRLLTFKELEA